MLDVKHEEDHRGFLGSLARRLFVSPQVFPDLIKMQWRTQNKINTWYGFRERLNLVGWLERSCCHGPNAYSYDTYPPCGLQSNEV